MKFYGASGMSSQDLRGFYIELSLYIQQHIPVFWTLNWDQTHHLTQAIARSYSHNNRGILADIIVLNLILFEPLDGVCFGHDP